MGNSEDYQAKLPEIMAIKVITTDIHMPLSVFLLEADNLALWCIPDREKLIKAGLDWRIADDIRVRAGALREAEVRWNAIRNAGKAATAQYREKMTEATCLRRRLIHDFLFAYKKVPELIRAIHAIAQSNLHAGIIQDLNDFSVLGKANPAPLEAIGFDCRLLNTAATLCRETSTLFAETSARSEHTEAKKIRDQAITLLKQAVDEVRQCGQYVFWQDRERKQGYTSAYLRKKKKNMIKTDASAPSVSPNPD